QTPNPKLQNPKLQNPKLQAVFFSGLLSFSLSFDDEVLSFAPNGSHKYLVFDVREVDVHVQLRAPKSGTKQFQTHAHIAHRVAVAKCGHDPRKPDRFGARAHDLER